MPFQATVLRVLVASPPDTTAARDAVRQAIADWNERNAATLQVMLLAVLWDTTTAPEPEERPQLIPDQLPTRDCDILIGTFWTKVFTPAGSTPSRTVQEIQQFVASMRPVLLYFSGAPTAPSHADPEQLKLLQAFRDDVGDTGIATSFDSVGQLRALVGAHLAKIVPGLAEPSNSEPSRQGAIASAIPSTAPGDRASAAHQYQAELRGLVARYQPDWGVVRQGRVDEAMRLMALLSQDLAAILGAAVSSLGGMDSELHSRLEAVTQRASAASKKWIRQDGGRSWQKFLRASDSVLAELATLGGQDWAALL